MTTIDRQRARLLAELEITDLRRLAAAETKSPYVSGLIREALALRGAGGTNCAGGSLKLGPAFVIRPDDASAN